MTQNLNKKDVNKTLRTVMFPVGIITTVLGFVWFILHASGTSSTDIKFVKDMIEAGRYVAIAFAFLALALAVLMISHASKQFVNVNKNNLKWELTSGIINGVVAILMLVFFIVIMTYVFDVAKWSYFYYSEEEGLIILGKKTPLVFAFMGILTALAMFIAVFARQFNKASLNGKNTNIKMLKTITVFAFVLALCNIIVVAMVMMGGFINLHEIGQEEFAEKLAIFQTSAYCAKYALAIVGTMAIAILAMIPLSLFGINDKNAAKSNAILWSIFGGIAFILFVVGAAMMTLKNVEGYVYPEKWEDNHVSASVIVLLSEIACLASGITALVATNKFAPKVAKA